MEGMAASAEEEAALTTLDELAHDNVGAGQDALQSPCQFPKGNVVCLYMELTAMATADNRC